MRFVSLLISGLLWIISLLLGASAMAQQPGEFVAKGDVWDISVEPNGGRVAILGPHYKSKEAFQSGTIDRKKNEIVIKSSANGETVKTFSWDDQFVQWLEWSDDGQLIICVSELVEKRTRYVLETNIYDLNVETGERLRAFKAKTARKFKQVPRIDYVRLSQDRQKAAVIYSLQGKKDLRVLDLQAGTFDIIARGDKRTLYWVLDGDLTPKLRVDKGKHSHIRNYYLPSGKRNSWDLMSSQNQLTEHFSVESVTETGDDFLVRIRPENTDTMGLYTFDMRTKSIKEKIFDTPKFDLAGAQFSSDTGDLLYASWWDDNLEHEFFYDEIRLYGQSLSARLGPDANWTLIHTRADDQVWLIYVSKDILPGEYFVWNNKTKTLSRVAQDMPRLNTAGFKKTERINYLASDGMPLIGYFTPAASDAKLNRIIVMPHGGPVARDNLDWDSWTQFFSVKGYDVFRPQFRGSGGFGLKFTQAGYGEWAGRMQTDIEDGVAALRMRGKISDQSRKAIIGASYGGYAALVAATRPEDDYECVVSINGVSDLPEMLGSYDRTDPVESNAYDIWSLRMGDPKTQMTQLEAASPARKTDAIKAKVRLLHGDEDEIVPIEQSRLMLEAAKASGVEISMKTLDGVGHNNWQGYTATGALDSTNWFLYRCFGNSEIR